MRLVKFGCGPWAALWLLFSNGDVSGWRGKRNRPRWKTSTEWQRRETVANHAVGIAPSAPTRSLEVTRCGSTESRENTRIHLGPRGRNGPLGAKLVKGRVCPEAAPLRCWQSVHKHTFCRRWIRRPDRMLDDPFGNRTVRANMHPGQDLATTTAHGMTLLETLSLVPAGGHDPFARVFSTNRRIGPSSSLSASGTFPLA